MSTIGSRIREKRLELGLSVDELAEKLGKNRATIYRYESDDIENFPISVIGPLSIVLQTSPAYLMGWKDSGSSWEDEFRHHIIEYLHAADTSDLENAGINKNEVLAIVEGKKSLSLESACSLADKFGLSIDSLVGRKGFETGREKPATLYSDGVSAKKRALIEAIMKMDDSDIDVVFAAADALIARRGK